MDERSKPKNRTLEYSTPSFRIPNKYRALASLIWLAGTSAAFLVTDYAVVRDYGMDAGMFFLCVAVLSVVWLLTALTLFLRRDLPRRSVLLTAAAVGGTLSGGLLVPTFILLDFIRPF